MSVFPAADSPARTLMCLNSPDFTPRFLVLGKDFLLVLPLSCAVQEASTRDGVQQRTEQNRIFNVLARTATFFLRSLAQSEVKQSLRMHALAFYRIPPVSPVLRLPKC